METINNRYRVAKNINQSVMLSSYAVFDMLKRKETVQVNIINSEYATNKLLEELTENYRTYTNIGCENIFNDYEFGLIDVKDNLKIKDKEYFFTSEFGENFVELREVIDNLDYNQAIDLFIQICNTISYLHKRDIVYGGINLSNVLTTYRNRKIIFKLRDLANVRLKQICGERIEENNYIFCDYVYQDNSKISKASDIYSLGILLLMFCVRDVSMVEKLINEKDIEGLLNSLVQQEDIKLGPLKNLNKIIERCLGINKEHTFSKASEIVQAINSELGRKYKAFNKEELERLNFKTRLIGREKQVKRILNLCKDMVNKNCEGKTILVHGEQGVGKTRFLKELDFRLSINKIDVHSSFELKGFGHSSDAALTDIKEKLFTSCEREILTKYQCELTDMIPHSGNTEFFREDREKYRFFDRGLSFIRDVSKNRFTVFIIDNLETADKLTFEFIEYLYTRNLKDTAFILSYCDSEILKNKEFNKFFTTVINCINHEEVLLEELSSEDTIRFISNMLNITPKYAQSFKKIYSSSYGNPMRIQEIIKNLYIKNAIYIDENTGEWKKNKNFKKALIPESVEQDAQNQIKSIESQCFDLLESMSVFNVPIDINYLSSLYQGPKEELKEIISKLINKGIITNYIKNDSIIYVFNNKIVKNIIYKRIKRDKRKIKHLEASNLISGEYKSKIGLADEYIFHLEKAGEIQKAIEVSMETAAELKKMLKNDAALKKMQKALKLSGTASLLMKKMCIYIEMGKIYGEQGQWTKAINNYVAAERIADNICDFEGQADIYNKLTIAYENKNDQEKVSSYINKSKQVLAKINYPKGEIELSENEVYQLIYKGKMKEAYSYTKECLLKYKNLYEDFTGKYYSILGKVLSGLQKPEESLEALSKALTYFEGHNDINNKITVLNNMGVIYGNYYQDDEGANKCFLKMLEVASKNKNYNKEALALYNLSQTYFNHFDYKKALEYCEKSLKSSIIANKETLIFYSYNFLTMANLKTYNYKKAIENHVLTKQEFMKHPVQGLEIVDHYYQNAIYNFEFGNYEEALKSMDKGIRIIKDDSSTSKYYYQILRSQILIAQGTSESSVRKEIYNIKKAAGKIESKDIALNYLCDSAILIAGGQFRNLYILIYDKISKEEMYDADLLKAKAFYLQGIHSKGNKKLKILKKALELSKKENDKGLSYKICIELGDYYLSRGNYIGAANCYFEALNIVKYLTMQLNPDLRLNYVNTKVMGKPYYRLLSIMNHYEKQSSYFYYENNYKIKDENQLKQIFIYEPFRAFLNNKYLKKDLKKIYNKQAQNCIDSIENVISSLELDPIENLKIIIKHLSFYSIATNACIILDEGDERYSVIASHDDKNVLPRNMNILESAKEQKKPVVFKGVTNKGLAGEFKAVICIPLIPKINNEITRSNKRRKLDNEINKDIIGYLYLESERLLNNFDDSSVQECKTLSPLICFIIQKYKLKISSSIDKLTGTLIRKYLDDALSDTIKAYKNSDRTFSIIMFDIDNFKAINDRYGHQTGDKVLREVCRVVKSNLKRNDIFGRFGGEEFVIILPEINSQNAMEIAEHIRYKIDTEAILGEEEPVTISMGVTSYTKNTCTEQELLERVDQALYKAKKSGKNSCRLWNGNPEDKNIEVNNLLGVISGNTISDYRHVLAIVELIELIRQNVDRTKKIYEFLGRIIETTEAEQGTLFIIEDEKVKECYKRKALSEQWGNNIKYNQKTIDKVMKRKQGISLIDWDNIANYDARTGMPYWNSTIAAPVIENSKVNGILYLTVPINQKEFGAEELNYISIVAEFINSYL